MGSPNVYVSTTSTFDYICEGNSLNYLDIAHCNDQQDILIEGINDCNNCSFEWSPSQYLDNPNIPSPTILGSINTLALDQTYHLDMTNEFGCLYTQDVTIFNVEELMGTIELSTTIIDICDYSAEFTINFTNDEILSIFSEISIDVYVTGPDYNGYSNNGYFNEWYEIGLDDLISYSPDYKTLTYRIPINLPRGYDRNVFVRVSNVDLPSNYNSIGNCSFSEEFNIPPSNYFHGPIEIYVPNSFSPGSANNGTFGPYFNLEDRNVDEAEMRIYNRWGGLLYVGNAVAPDNGPGLTGTESELVWDGLLNGVGYNSGVYIWVLEYGNCSQSKTGCFSDSNGIINFDVDDCNNDILSAPHYGEFYIVY